MNFEKDQTYDDFSSKYGVSIKALSSIAEIQRLRERQNNLKNTYNYYSTSRAKKRHKVKYNEGMGLNPCISLNFAKISNELQDRSEFQDKYAPINIAHFSKEIEEGEQKKEFMTKIKSLTGKIPALPQIIPSTSTKKSAANPDPLIRITELQYKHYQETLDNFRRETPHLNKVRNVTVGREASTSKGRKRNFSSINVPATVVNDSELNKLDKSFDNFGLLTETVEQEEPKGRKVFTETNWKTKASAPVLFVKETDVFRSAEGTKRDFAEGTFDMKMGKPFIKIRIDNITDFKEVPLENYDIMKDGEEISPKELMNKGKPVIAFSRWVSTTGEMDWKPCKIIGYDEESSKYKIKWLHTNQEKEVVRLNLRMETEDRNTFDLRFNEALNKRYQTLYLQSYKNNIMKLNDKFDLLLYSPLCLERIIKSIPATAKLNLNLENNDTVLTLLEEVLGEYKYENLRFILEIRNNNNDLKRILSGRGIKTDVEYTSMVPCRSSVSDSLLIVDSPVELGDQNVLEAYYQIKMIDKYCLKTESTGLSQERKLVIACDMPCLDLKGQYYDDNYHQLARKSVKLLYPKPEKLFATIIPTMIKQVKDIEDINLYEDLVLLHRRKKKATLQQLQSKFPFHALF